METKINKVFLYGTLRSGMINHSVIAPFIETITKGEIKGQLFHLSYGYPALRQGNGKVKGELVQIKDVANALIRLDDLEGYVEPPSKRNLYNRELVTVWTEDDEMPHAAYAYFWANSSELDNLGTLIPDGDWPAYLNHQGLTCTK
ncbi:gamma-glutamylcyclotransferase family protein [Heliophilum fasciatum]|uniref:Gamma-glutamylcyclotransferase (GGCT)/AIG2-like uncharacterized protein YtfP n=1 Tax=Heliophilum fasciatum TaxID=35700 RepID=A0A4R2RLW3_9FIRM|nr:gamma-glutamylcyclotransferase family protein [Heliophilum fasciatum]MCW2278225.1 gamma-glutamylcyclotransferase (GGCT)/AIG2-like uncharacterized protein YtfP [Heliophilum fasciatum]TCP63954.1 gamma-glutamylcyclotransferase (GGCT)/AIG2-like uncharacterized protein YtfP [Heliophilum fasciatum]